MAALCMGIVDEGGRLFFKPQFVQVQEDFCPVGKSATRARGEQRFGPSDGMHPTVNTAVEQLGRWIRRGRYRSVALEQFPWEIWEKLVVQGNEARETVRFIDKSGLGRSPSQLIERLRQLDVAVAIGGVAGARHYDHDIDLVGNPRLDLTLHQERGEMATSWMGKLDPALERADGDSQSASVLVHVLRRHDPLFASNRHGQRSADPAECLLDLVDCRLDDQARRFADHFNKKIPVR